MSELITIRGGRTGTKIHLAFAGGIWLKANVRHFEVSGASVTCERCRELWRGALTPEGKLRR